METPWPGPTQLADLNRNLGDARSKPSIKSIYSYIRFRSQIFAEAISKFQFGKLISIYI